MSGVRLACVTSSTKDPFRRMLPKWESPGTNQFSNAHDQHSMLPLLVPVFLAVVLAAWWAGKACVRKKEARRTVAMEQTNLKYPPSNVSPFRLSAMAARPTIRAVCVLAVLAVYAAHLAAETNQVRRTQSHYTARALGLAPTPSTIPFRTPFPPPAPQASTCHRCERSPTTST